MEGIISWEVKFAISIETEGLFSFLVAVKSNEYYKTANASPRYAILMASTESIWRETEASLPTWQKWFNICIAIL